MTDLSDLSEIHSEREADADERTKKAENRLDRLDTEARLATADLTQAKLHRYRLRLLLRRKDQGDVGI